MVCNHCGTQNPPNARFCMHCSSPIPQLPPREEQPSSYSPSPARIASPQRPSPLARELGDTYGTVSLVLGILAALCGVICFCAGSMTLGASLAVSVMGILFGALGISNSKKGGTGNTKAVVGLILSIVPMVLFVIILFVLAILFFFTFAVPVTADISAFPYSYYS